MRRKVPIVRQYKENTQLCYTKIVLITKTLDNQLQQYLPLLVKEEKQLILTFNKGFVKSKEAPPKRFTIEEYNRELEAAEVRTDAGEFTTLGDAIKHAETW